MLMDAVLERFVAKSPMAVAVRGAFEYALASTALDELFVRAAVADGVSDHHLAREVSGTCPGLWIAVPAQQWAEIGGWSVGRMADRLVGLARRASPGRYKKATRGPKKPSPPRTRFAEAKHIAISRLLNGEQT